LFFGSGGLANTQSVGIQSDGSAATQLTTTMTINVTETGGDYHMLNAFNYYSSGTVTANPAFFSVTIDQIPATTDSVSMDRISVLERKLKALQVNEEFHETNEQLIQRNYNFFFF